MKKIEFIQNGLAVWICFDLFLSFAQILIAIVYIIFAAN